MRRGHTVQNYATAQAIYEYGNAKNVQVGDFFNDIMGSVVPGWDNRPDWMKKIVVKPDPAKLLKAAGKIVSPAQAGSAVDTAAQYGFNVFANTPGGQVPVTGATVRGAMEYGPGMYQYGQALSAVPIWVYAGGAALVLLLIMKK